MSAETGKRLVGEQHLAQSITDIITTPQGSRVGRRAYGSLIPHLIDQPVNGANTLRLYAATSHALAKWEPRATLVNVTLNQAAKGKSTLSITSKSELGTISQEVIM